jgi:predicted dehydrogenase
MDKDFLRVGVIGIGLYSTLAHVPQLRATGRAEVVAICRRSADKLAFSQQQLGVESGYTDWRALLEHPGLDAVVISTPHDQHAEQGMAALDRGLSVLMEKPLALTLSDASAVVVKAQKVARVLTVGYNRRFIGVWRTLHHLLSQNAIGTIRQVNLQYALYRRLCWEGKEQPELRVMLQNWTGWPEEFLLEWEMGKDWHANPGASGGGMFSNSGSHLVDLILWLAGSYPTQVVSFSESDGMPAECFLNISAQLANGVQVSVTSADVESGGFLGKGTMAIVGDKGVIAYDFAKPAEIWKVSGDQREMVTPQYPDTNAAAAFVASVLDGAENQAPSLEGAYTVAFTEAVYTSAAEGRIVAPDYSVLLQSNARG